MTMIAKSHSFIYLFFFSSLPNGRRYGDLPSDKCRQSWDEWEYVALRGDVRKEDSVGSARFIRKLDRSM